MGLVHPAHILIPHIYSHKVTEDQSPKLALPPLILRDAESVWSGDTQ